MSVGTISAPRAPAPAPATPSPPQRSSFISRAGMNSLMTNPTISFVEKLAKVRIFAALLFALFLSVRLYLYSG